MGISQEVLGILVRLEGKTAFIAGVREEQAVLEGFTASQRRQAAASNEQAAANARNASTSAMVTKGMKGLGLITVATLVEGVKMSMNFNRELEMIHTQAGASQHEVDQMRKGILSLHGLPQSPIELAQGLFHLESIGLRGPKALEALRIAAEGAATGNAHLEDTTSALGGAWLTGIKGAGDMRNVMGILNATVGQGNLKMNELVEALGTGILPAAKYAGIGISDIGAAVAVLKDENYPASSATAQLGTALHFLYAPTTKATNALATLGITQHDMVAALEGPHGLHGALKLLQDHLNNISDQATRKQVLGEIFPGGRGRVLLVLMNQLERLEEKQNKIEGASGAAYAAAVKRNMEEPQQRVKIAISEVEKELIKIGEQLEGPAASAAEILAGVLIFLLSTLMALTDQGKLLAPILITLVAAWTAYKGVVILANIYSAIAGAIMAGTAAAAVAETMGIEGLSAAFFGLGVAMDTAGIGLVFLALTGLIILTYMLVKHFKDVVHFFEHNWKMILSLLTFPISGFLVYVATHLGKVKTWFMDLIHWVEKNWGKIVHVLVSPFDWLWRKASWVIDHIKKLAGTVTSTPGKLLNEIEGGLESINPLNFAAGGTMPHGGLATINENGPGERVYLPGGSVVQPSPVNSMALPRSHAPNPLPPDPAEPSFNLEAVLVLPNGDVLADLTTKSLKKKKNRA